MDIGDVQHHIEIARQQAMVLAAAGRLPVSATDAAEIRQRLERHLCAAVELVRTPDTLPTATEALQV